MIIWIVAGNIGNSDTVIVISGELLVVLGFW